MRTCTKCGAIRHTLFDATCEAAKRYIPRGELRCFDCLQAAHTAYMATPEGKAEHERLMHNMHQALNLGNRLQIGPMRKPVRP